MPFFAWRIEIYKNKNKNKNIFNLVLFENKLLLNDF